MSRSTQTIRVGALLGAMTCRFGCDSGVVGLYSAPSGCICWPDKIQALCAQHAVKGMQNNDMTAIVEDAEFVKRRRT